MFLFISELLFNFAFVNEKAMKEPAPLRILGFGEVAVFVNVSSAIILLKR